MSIKSIQKALKNNENRLFIAIAALAYLFSALLALKTIIGGTIPFWYDPARDILLGVENLKKLTLIGPPTGIPNIFYGPYWVWLISFALLMSKDPRFVTFVVVFLPYFVFLPFILYKFSKVIGKTMAIVIWVLFTTSFSYHTQIWNPHLAPLLLFVFIYLLLNLDLKKYTLLDYAKTGFAGLILGFLINFHISFGIGVFGASMLMWLVNAIVTIREKNGKKLIVPLIIHLVTFLVGVGITYVPFLLFEARHGFNQIKAIIYTLRKSILENSSVVGQVGMSKPDIIKKFFTRVSEGFQIQPLTLIGAYLFGIVIAVATFLKKKPAFDTKEKKLLMILGIISITVLYIYLSSKNPVWEYHFVAVEVVFLLFFGLIAKKVTIIRYAIVAWTLVLVFNQSVHFVRSLSETVTYACYKTVREEVDIIFNDAQKKPFAVLAYNPGIYTFEYDYMFDWLGSKYGFTPGKDPKAVDTTYLIIPKTQKAKFDDFINYRTPNKEYKTAKVWHQPDGVTILKRVKK